MSIDESRIKHLEWIQAIISRQAANSFLLKGWSITLVAGLFALASKDSERAFLWLAWLPVVAFGGLDAFYLHQEKRFIALYNCVQKGNVSPAQVQAHGQFCLNPSSIVVASELPSLKKSLSSPAIWGFYGPLLLASLFVAMWLSQNSEAKRPRPSAAAPTTGQGRPIRQPVR